MKAELDEHLGSEALHSDTVQAQEEIQRQKDKRAIKRLPQRANFATQVKAALIRDYQQRWGDQWTFWARQFTTTLQALLAGSTFYMVSDNTGGLFTRGGVIFLTILNPSLISLAETTAAFSGRAVTSKHKAFSMYRPSAVYIAQTIGDLPIFFLQIALYTIIIYFMAGLKRDPGLYFTYLLITYVTTLCTTAFFRFIGYSFGTFENASKVSGFMFSVIVTYAGTYFYAPAPRTAGILIYRVHHLHTSNETLVRLDQMDQPDLLCRRSSTRQRAVWLASRVHSAAARAVRIGRVRRWASCLRHCGRSAWGDDSKRDGVDGDCFVVLQGSRLAQFRNHHGDHVSSVLNFFS
jgi:ABC-type multidrug transport system permease subunit